MTHEDRPVLKAASRIARRLARRVALRAAALESAGRLAASPSPAARWVGKDALRDLAKKAELLGLKQLAWFDLTAPLPSSSSGTSDELRYDDACSTVIRTKPRSRICLTCSRA